MIAPISSEQLSRLRQSMERPGFDLSPGGQYSAKAVKDQVTITEVATGATRVVKFPDHTVEDVTVSDKGDAVLKQIDWRQGGAKFLSHLQPDGTLQDLGSGWSATSPELSSDGSRLVWAESNSVQEMGPAGARKIADIPYSGMSCGILDDGRILVRTSVYEQRFDREISEYRVIGTDGKNELLEGSMRVAVEAPPIPLEEDKVREHLNGAPLEQGGMIQAGTNEVRIGGITLPIRKDFWVRLGLGG